MWIVIALLAASATLQWLFFPRPFPKRHGEERRTSALTAFQSKPDKTVYAGYAGSESCRNCHADAYAAWRGSHHAEAERGIDLARDRSAFEPPRTIHHASQTSTARMEGGHPQMVTMGPKGQRRPFNLERVLGFYPLRQYMTRFPRGRWQVLELAFDPSKHEWFDVYGNEDRKPGEWGHWTGRGMNWNSMCADCHNTRLRKHYQGDEDSYQTTRAEQAVGCEACHGPMAAHVRWARQHPNSSKPDPTLPHFTPAQAVDTCGSCHSRRGELTGGFVPGDKFSDHYSLVIPDETDVYYPDGQVHLEDYEYAAFLGSRMHAAGVTCLDCHNPHTGKTLFSGNVLCLRCHGQVKSADPRFATIPFINPSEHTHHAFGQAGSRCVDCHMPVTTYMQRHPRRDHGFTIPDPLLTEEFGIPNACNRCHTKTNAAWALAYVKRWYGKKMQRPTRRRAEWIARARRGDHAALSPLIDLSRNQTNAYWRAVATGLLKFWAGEPAVQAALHRRLRDASPLVRANSVDALEPYASQGAPELRAALRPLLRDRSRSVRIEAAWALRSDLDAKSVAGKDLLHDLAFNSDQPAGALQRGVYELDRGNLAPALALFRRAVAWDPHSAPFRQALAVALSQHGDKEQAVDELQTACRLSPKNADYRFKLGLALNEVGRLTDAIAALQKAVALDSGFAQAWYNLGLAYSAAEQPDGALRALNRAESLNPSSPRIPYARATILARLDRKPEARQAARKALELEPNFTAASRLLQMLSSGGE